MNIEHLRQKFEQGMRLQGFTNLKRTGRLYDHYVVEERWQGFLMGWRASQESGK